MTRTGQEIQREWASLELRVRNAFRGWADCRLHVLKQTSEDRYSIAARFDRLATLSSSTVSPEHMAHAWSSSLDASSSIAKARFLTEVLRTGETPQRFLERVIRYMEKEPAIAQELLVRVGHIARRRKGGTKKWSKFSFELYGLYERRLHHYDIPQSIELMVESALYALYVAWSPQSKIILVDNRRELLRAIAMDEALVRVVTPRRFEELVAYVYELLGCRIELTKATRDWGADVLAWQPGPFGDESLIVVQTKLYSGEEKVSLAGVHALHGAVTHYNAAHGHLVATSDLTGPAHKFMERTGYKFVDLSALRREVTKLFV